MNNAVTDRGQFQTTHWSVVLLASQTDVPGSSKALQTLCSDYWYPLYAFVRRKGHPPEDAQDLTQDFFARLLEKRLLKVAVPERGRFRSFLLKVLQNFLLNSLMRSRAVKRGGGELHLSIDALSGERKFLAELATSAPAEVLYDKGWALTVLDRAMVQLASNYADPEKRALFDVLRGVIFTECSSGFYQQRAEGLGMSENALKMAAHRMRQKFRGIVRAEIGRTVATPDEIDEELRHLMKAVAL